MEIKEIITQLSERFENVSDKELFELAVAELEESEGDVSLDDVLALYEGIGNDKGEIDSDSGKKAESEMNAADSSLVDPLHNKFNSKPKENQDESELDDEKDEMPGVKAKAEKIDAFAQKLNNRAKENQDKRAVGAVKESTENSAEGISKIFEGEEFTEEFKEKAGVILESFVKSRIDEEVDSAIAMVIEEAKLEFDEAITEMEDKLSQYIEYVAEKFMEENEIAIESSIRLEIAESVLNGIKAVMIENNIEVPDDKLDIVEAVIQENDELKNEYNEIAEGFMALKEEYLGMKKNIVVEELCADMTELDKERFKKIFEGLEYVEDESFKRKASYLMEAYKPTEKIVVTTQTLKEDVDDNFKPDEEIDNSKSSPEARAVADFIKKNSRYGTYSK